MSCIELTEEERKILEEILRGDLAEYRSILGELERDPTMRELRRKEAVLRALLHRLEEPEQTAEGIS